MASEKGWSWTRHKDITPGPRIPWNHAGSASEHLQSHLEKLYWTGVSKELESLVQMLRKWQLPEFDDILLEESLLIDGFDTFINQVIPRADVAERKDPRSEYARKFNAYMAEVAQEVMQKRVKVAVHKRLNQRPIPERTLVRRRARLLLQGAGFLDIEKLTEHRLPQGHGSADSVNLPQYKLNGKRHCGCPDLLAVFCSKCKNVIRGSHFDATGKKPRVVCENCYWEHHYEDRSFSKHYKHSILPTVAEFRRWCFGRHREGYHYLWTDPKFYYSSQRGWLRLDPLKEIKDTPSTKFRYSNMEREIAESEIMGSFVQTNPFGGVHMSLRIGPLVVENGVAHTKQGAFITLREPTFQRLAGEKPKGQVECLAVSPERERQLWYQSRPIPSTPKRFNAVLKQIVGIPFSSSTTSEAEGEIIDLIVRASQTDHKQSDLLVELDDKIKGFLSPWVSVYLERIANKLLDPKVSLTWDPTLNHCLQFCDSLLDWSTFGCLVPEPTVALTAGSVQPLYRLSFICRPGAFPKAPFSAEDIKPDVPYGLTEEYLRRFWYGGHTGSDLIDRLQEYWYDWAAFTRPLYPHQNLFPWDCTQAAHRSLGQCGKCTLAKHLWAFPFDSWSIIALHLLRDRPLYPEQQTGASSSDNSEHRWMRDRIKLLSALEILLAGAEAMSQEPLFRQATSWLHQQTDQSRDRVKLGGIFRAQPNSHATEARPYDAFFVADWSGEDNNRSKQIAYETARQKRHDPGLARDNSGDLLSVSNFLASPSRHAPPLPRKTPTIHIPTAWFTSSNVASNSVCGAQGSAAGCVANCSADCSTGNCGSGDGGGDGGGCGGGGCGGGD